MFSVQPEQSRLYELAHDIGHDVFRNRQESRAAFTTYVQDDVPVRLPKLQRNPTHQNR